MNIAGHLCSQSRLSSSGSPPPVAQQPVPVKTQKNAVGAAIASALWCGLGQTYNGQPPEGVGFMAGITHILCTFLCTSV